MKIALLGTVGVPGRYGGFETLAENLVRYHARNSRQGDLTVWCSSKDNPTCPAKFESAQLRYIGLQANGVQSTLYDTISLLQAIRSGHNHIVLLGVSGAMALPLVRIFSSAQILTNIDGIEWKRKKWKRFAQLFLRASEWAAVRFSHKVIADNQAIAEYVRLTYDTECYVIAYGGDHAVTRTTEEVPPEGLPETYALALCRIEPENSVHTILEAWAQLDSPLVFVGNWENSQFGRKLKARYAQHKNLYLLDPIYDAGTLYALRSRASIYVHGHSAGGTNPSLVEMMHFGVPVLAHGCIFNRYTTEEKARYFKTSSDLTHEVKTLSQDEASTIGAHMHEIAKRRYTWNKIGAAYFELVER